MRCPKPLELDTIFFCDTTEADLPTVLALERDDANSPYIRQWPADLHRAAMADPNYAHFVICTVADQQPIGYAIFVGLQNPDLSLEFKRLVISDKGHGYGRLAMRLGKRFAFEMLHFHRLWLEVAEHNERGFHIYSTEGFTLEGVHRESMKQGSKFVSLKVMSILAEEYEP